MICNDLYGFIINYAFHIVIRSCLYCSLFGATAKLHQIANNPLILLNAIMVFINFIVEA